MNQATDYYNKTAVGYDGLHNEATNPEHTMALELAWPLFDKLKVCSVLDVGCGTGRTLIWLKRANQSLQLFGLEPARSMLDIAIQNIPDASFRLGNGEALPYEDGSIDVVIATGIMHHASDPLKVISEMFRVARSGILISDHNNYAFGSSFAKKLRLGLRVVGLLDLFTFVKQGFKKQGYSEEDGWWFPYSLLDHYGAISKHASCLYMIPTRPPTGNMDNIIFSQSHICVAAIKRQSPASL